MTPGISSEFYLRALASVRGDGFLCEDVSPPERWMQQIWRHQRLHRDQLRTLDGQGVRVLHPGFWNREAGPDFRDAVIQIGGEPARRGDVELDRAVGGWRSHHHAGNPAYRFVVLHVVWTSPVVDLHPPVMAMQPYLDAPLGELASWLEHEAPGLLPANLPGHCCGPLGKVSPEQFREILLQAAGVRLRRKASEFAARARQAGWDQALWEGLCAALGYKHNAWPMRRLAEMTPIGSAVAQGGDSVLNWEARLLGLSGLLPDQLPRGDARLPVRQLWDSWWRERDAWAEQVMPSFVWRTDGVRPANHPQRRLILAARWRAGGFRSSVFEGWLAEDVSRGRSRTRLLALLTPLTVPEDYWAHHATLRSRSSPLPLPLLGATRLTELALNVVLPWLHARAMGECREDRLAEVERRYFDWPAAGDNAALRLARQRLLGGAPGMRPRSGAAQQGLHQILCDFCQHAGPLCDACRFPSVVESLASTRPAP